MRLLVWRLSRLNGSSHQGHRTAKSKDVVKIILTFNARLDAIRKRHDQLSPVSEFLGTQEEEDRRRRRKYPSSSFFTLADQEIRFS
jgi:ATP-dependent exoDNAse (exonuclease V) alpha subunit